MRGVELQPEAGLVVTAVGSDENGAS
jgi:hypothetical protein